MKVSLKFAMLLVLLLVGGATSCTPRVEEPKASGKTTLTSASPRNTHVAPVKSEPVAAPTSAPAEKVEKSSAPQSAPQPEAIPSDLADGENWPMYLGNSGRTNYLDVAPLTEEPTILWEARAAGFAPIVGNGRVFLMNKTSVTALDAATGFGKNGGPLWETAGAFLDLALTAPTLHGKTLFVPGAQSLSALDTETGAILYQLSPDGPEPAFPKDAWFVTSPLVIDETLFFTKWRRVFAYDLKNNKYLWQYPTVEVAAKSAEIGTHLTFCDNTLALGLYPEPGSQETEFKLYPWFRKDPKGKILLLRAFPERVNQVLDREIEVSAYASTPLSIYRDTAVVATGFEGIASYFIGTGTENWKKKTPLNLRGCGISITPDGLAIQGGTVCQIIDLQAQGRVKVDLKKSDPTMEMCAPALILKSHFYYGNAKGFLVCRKLEDGAVIWKKKITKEERPLRATVAYSQGRLYVADGERVHCLGMEGGK